MAKRTPDEKTVVTVRIFQRDDPDTHEALVEIRIESADETARSEAMSEFMKAIKTVTDRIGELG